MHRFRVLTSQTFIPRASTIAGQTLLPREGASYHLNMAPYKNAVGGQPVYTYTLPKRSRTQLQLAMNSFDSNLYKLNEMWQHAGLKAFEAVICAIPQFMNDSAQPLTQLIWDPQDVTHHCNCVNQNLGASLAPNYLLVSDTHFGEGGPVYTPSSTICFTTKQPLRDFVWPGADFAPQQVILLRPAPRNAAGKSKTFRVFEVLRNVRIAEYGLVQLGVLVTNVLPNEGDVFLRTEDLWVLGY